ncbi:hypothetical protein [Photobacterium phosphoreum]|uniref:hypothetical protein n=1 Tax=Photobacterium phosphoreum TaxID=659 RepID=UPI0007F8D749|nr:hypothetical protein [Photobacterium phosphoreum]OBU37402.1 hypothetical protein AYY24_11285 [Photobacterium phosphoreum]PSW38042.1 hypothetical protein CTM87_05720 [Photobacterium phosphoreum]
MTYNQYNQYNQSSVTQSITVTVVNVNYINIVQNSDIHRYLVELRKSQIEFEMYLKTNISKEQLLIKAIEISTKLQSLMEQSDNFHRQEKRNFSLNVLESTIYALELFKKSDIQDEVRCDLCNKFKDFYRYQFNSVDKHLLFNLQCYEFCLKEKLIQYDKYTFDSYEDLDTYSYIYDDASLEEFFTRNRKEVLEFIINNSGRNGYVNYDSPISRERKYTEVKAFMLLRKFDREQY